MPRTAMKGKPSKTDTVSYGEFCSATIDGLERSLASSSSREEAIFYRTLINLKLQLAQERIVGETLL